MAKWNLDPTHSAATFAVRHMMISTVHGVIKNATGTLEFDAEHPEKSLVEATLNAASIFTDLEQRDNHLKSADFLDVSSYPHITFKSSKVEVNGENTAKVTGDLTIRSTTRPVTLEVEFLGQQKSPYGQTAIGFSATTKINREDFGLVWNVALESGGVLVGKEVKITLDVEAVQA